jgi:large conductance mechanosensitive channel
MLNEFREFILRGNVVDLAVGIIIGAAFGAIVTSLVADIIMPPIGFILGNVDFSALMIVLKEGNPPGPYGTLQAAKDAGAVTINVGQFLNVIINFLIVALAMFLVVRAVNQASKMRRKQVEAGATPAEPTVEEKTLAVLEKLDARLEKIAP